MTKRANWVSSLSLTPERPRRTDVPTGNDERSKIPDFTGASRKTNPNFDDLVIASTPKVFYCMNTTSEMKAYKAPLRAAATSSPLVVTLSRQAHLSFCDFSSFESSNLRRNNSEEKHTRTI